ncbi:MAG TPA: ferritin-like domain-containing protein [Nitrososphaera sp.]
MGGRTEKKILAKNAANIANLLKCAYCDEMRIFHYFSYAGINMEGIGLVTYAAALKTRATGELSLAEPLADRIAELGDKAPSDPAEWANYSTTGALDPAEHLTLGTALDRAPKFEGKAVENCGSMEKQAPALGDYVTYNLDTAILADEVKDERHREDILKSLEVK